MIEWTEVELEALQSLAEVVGHRPERAKVLLETVKTGQINGRSAGERGMCGCVLGELSGAAANYARWSFLRETRDAIDGEGSLALSIECFVDSLCPGDTPATNPRSALLAVWLEELIASNEGLS